MIRWQLWVKMVCFTVLVLFAVLSPRPGIASGIPFQPVPPIQAANWTNFKILIWPLASATDVLEDYDLYQEIGLEGFQIDRGRGQARRIRFSVSHDFPYYAGHVADKGFLHLTGENRQKVTGKRGLVARPHSLADPGTLAAIKNHIRLNMTAARKGRVRAYALDDEVSLGRLINPSDVDASPEALQLFRRWLAGQYASIQDLNRQWGTSFEDFAAVVPKGFEQVRPKLKMDLSQWNLSPWMDFRRFMDIHFAGVLAELVGYANELDPDRPAGIVGGQAPAPWGGYDYALLSRAVQWMEAYDIHETNEILRSFWDKERRLRLQTFFSSGDFKQNSWFLWYYFLHGNQGVIAWPKGWFEKGRIADHVRNLQPVFEELQGPLSHVLIDPKTHFDPDPIAIYLSQPSIRTSWAMDALYHGRTWPNRLTSIDNQNQSAGLLRSVWCRTLEDLGYQYDFVSSLDLHDNQVDMAERFKVVILPKTVCLSDKEAQLLEQFVRRGGVLIADSMCGLMDEHGQGRASGILDQVFGLARDPDRGYLDSRALSPINAEYYRRPFLERFTPCRDAYRFKGMAVVERGTESADKQGVTGIAVKGGREAPEVLITQKVGKGWSVYLNLSPLEYLAPERRFGEYGRNWLGILQNILDEAGLEPRLRILEKQKARTMIEPLYWRQGERQILGLVKNPGLDKSRAELGGDIPIQGVTGKSTEITLHFSDQLILKDLRTGENLGKGRTFEIEFKPWEGRLYEILPGRD